MADVWINAFAARTPGYLEEDKMVDFAESVLASFHEGEVNSEEHDLEQMYEMQNEFIGQFTKQEKVDVAEKCIDMLRGVEYGVKISVQPRHMPEKVKTILEEELSNPLRRTTIIAT